MSKSLVIVESPTKAKTISKFLPKGYEVLSSMGHIRDLPSSAKEIPAKYKKEKWASLGVDVENNFEPLYVISPNKKKTVKQLVDSLKGVDELILATDEDREGEAISWHLLQVLKPKVVVKRMVFHEITKGAIEEALTNFRDIDLDLVYAQEGRRILDRLVGYTISPVLWKKIAPKLSAGRVQSVAVALLIERERERMRFKDAEYWDLLAMLNKDKTNFSAQLATVGGKRIAQGSDFERETGQVAKGKDVIVLKQADVEALVPELLKANWSVTDVDTKKQSKAPAPPFITSTLQQEGGRKLGMSARETMSVAQKLYEKGFITYMRTDSFNLSGQAISAARKCVESKYGKEYLYKSVRQYKTKSKGAQEAHEAIRPAGTTFKDPVKTGLVGLELRLYDLIWKRTIATQMAEAQVIYTQATILAEGKKNEAEFKAKGKFIEFPGFFRAYVEGSDNPEGALEDQDELLPELKVGDKVDCKTLEPLQHLTKPPSRYTEASLIKALESEGVGRPSTYAAVISTIQDRGYVNKVNNALVPTFTAFAVTQLLEKYFPDLVDVKFTAAMEEELDKIAEGKVQWQAYLKEYYSDKKGLKNQVVTVEDKIDPGEARKLDLPVAKELKIEVLVGRYGAYIKKDGKEELSASIPEEYAPSDLSAEVVEKIFEYGGAQNGEGKSLGVDKETGQTIYVKIGRYGPYVQLGSDLGEGEEGEKPKRASLTKDLTMEAVTLDQAMQLLSLPRILGDHPETAKVIKAGLGRFGPYIVHDGDFRSLKKEDNLFTIDLKRALELLAEEKKGRGGSKVLKELGEYPGSKNKMQLLSGRYGHYIKCGKVNVSLPKDVNPDDLTLEQAAALVKGKKK
ncbi:DNA topoisomerase I [Candidatus Peregrinibacteria bacterium CG11_big_fil_rev_8_21_14_0_20_41_10]|nr:MAG: DNA topoisomerase I [Candidatus Peregrinibacteria bacterium CG11_big_fil_rev_8_21_14_0_20_41_10]PIZ77623.1 MAG: type I DNA topoisomerase [Candidatus Peregrinibacteria bacterium CG_4_10_14_0_2_um_filter_41_8]